MERVWVKNGDAVRQVAESAVRVMEVSGWKALSKTEVDRHEKHLAAAREERAVVNAPAPNPEQDPKTQPARAAQDKES